MNKLLPLMLALGLMLGSYKGYIALFDREQEEPKQVFPYAVTSLPPDDQKALRQRIPVANEGELCRLLEDYLS